MLSLLEKYKIKPPCFCLDVFLALIFNLLNIISNGQTQIQTEEIKSNYTNGYEVFHICKTNPTLNLDDKKEYYWYTEYAGIKKTKGGSGGNLLHGIYKLYYETGNLRQEINYNLGLPHGTEKDWDSLGNITTIAKYVNGNMIYWKFLNDERNWIETIGEVFATGTIRKVYTQYNTLIEEDSMIENIAKQHVKTYYESTHKLKLECNVDGYDMEYHFGKYKSYFEKGKVKVDGQYYNGDFTNIRVGTWKFYNSDGTLESTEQYKSEVEFWDDNQLKMAGGYILDAENNQWLKTGEWAWFDETGMTQTTKNYKWGVEEIK